MLTIVKLKSISFGFLMILGSLCFAQENIRFERISVNEGLSQSDVKSIVQDDLGFLWIGTRDGLNRYDGLEFYRYGREKGDSTSLYFNQILDLQVDLSGNIWVGSAGGLSIYNYSKDNFQNFFPIDTELQGIEVNHILLTGERTALLSTNKGLVSFDLRQRKFFTDQDLVLFKEMRVSHAYQSEEHGLWVGTEKGVFIKTSSESGWTGLLEGHSIQHIYFDRNDKVYLSGSKGLFRYDLAKKIVEQIILPNSATPIEVMRMKSGELWVASNQVIVLGKDDSLKYVLAHNKANNYSLSEDRARVLFQTRDDVIWVGTFGYGLNKFNPDVARFSYLSEQTSIPLSGNYVSAIFTSDDTTLLVGTSRGLDVIDFKTRSANHFSSDKDLFQIFKIVADRKNNVWVSTSNGLMLYSDNKLIPKNPLRAIYFFAEWDDASLILATRLNGIYLFDPKTNLASLFIPANDLPEEVSCMLVEDDHLWVGCKDGLKLFNRKGRLIKHHRSTTELQGSLQSSFIKSIYRDTAGNLWIGTWGGGLSMLNTKDSTFTTYNANNGLPNNVAYGILEDHLGTLWVTTNLGMSAFIFKDEAFRNFSFSDGLQSNEFNTGAYFKSASGKLYFGGVNGVSFFYSEGILKRQPLHAIRMTSITINNKALTFQDSDTLRNVQMIKSISSIWKENDIGIAFTEVDFKQPQENTFQYSIKDTTWYDIGNRRSFELLGLPSGQHVIKVRTKKPGSNWGENVVLLSINIVPPVWERAWFRIIALLVFLAIIVAAYRYRVARLKGMNTLLNKLVKDRTREIQAKNEEIAAQNDQLHELNKELQAFSYSVSHDLRTPLRSVIGYSKMLGEDYNEKLDEDGKRLLNVIQQNAVRMNNLIADLLEFSKLGSKELQKSEVGVSILVKGIIDQISTPTGHKAEIKLNPLPSVYADGNLLSQVWINLLSNAIKYSAKKERPIVEVGSYRKENEIVFYVKDNGAGFDMKYVDKLFGAFQRLHNTNEFEGTGVGLALVQRIIIQHGGRVWADGKVNEGATFYFSLPSSVT